MADGPTVMATEGVLDTAGSIAARYQGAGGQEAGRAYVAGIAERLHSDLVLVTLTPTRLSTWTGEE